MPLRSRPSSLVRLHDERGFTLIELLVAMIAGLVVSLAAFAILDTSLSQSSRIADRVSANQRGRIAMEKIMLELHSSCVAAEVTPVEPGSEANKLLIVSETGSAASFSKVALHKISFEGGKLIDTSYDNTGAKPAPNWVFNLETPTRTQTLLTGVTKTGATPIFQYYGYKGAELSKVLPTPLKEGEAESTAAITVSFTTAPESGNVGKIANDRTVDLVDTAVLRFSPASTAATNLPCA